MHKTYIGIVGSRRRNTPEDLQAVAMTFLGCCAKRKLSAAEVVIVSGGCPEGADHFAELIAEKYGCEMIIHYPDKRMLPDEPKQRDRTKINHARNTLIAEDADILIACVSDDRKGGTEDTIRKYLKFKKKELITC